jgi:hypothetical protein
LRGGRLGCLETSLLVGGFKHGFDFPFDIWDVILPIDELIVFKMVIAPPTSLEKSSRNTLVIFSSREPFDKMVDVHMIFPSLFINHHYLIIIYWYSTGL